LDEYKRNPEKIKKKLIFENTQKRKMKSGIGIRSYSSPNKSFIVKEQEKNREKINF
jgi:hypothetical protein